VPTNTPHTIKLILPQPAGGAVDLIARGVGDRLAEQMRQPVIVENMPGANGSLAAGAVSRPDMRPLTCFRPEASAAGVSL
jgi:tripartite-type tricarboxylate transporter receptor subunit TctC